ncbi:calexcitin-2 [Folsomia candida]|uniref:calexcitin-2 n=1 Tax=Folsomia candida TaxID=158441 RepID=UPI000B903533|nr:calexcitin-2 [Folsomia candida]
MAGSSFLEKKLNFVFDTFFDVSKDGAIQKEDFDLAIKSICKARGYQEGTPSYGQVSDAFLKVWEGLRQQGDADGDDEVDRNEWVTLWTSGGASESWKKLYMDFMFKLFDADDDGSISGEEFVMITGAFGVPKDEAVSAFKKISNDGKVEVSKDSYGKLWEEFFTSDDPSKPGNNIFGKLW